MLMLRKKIPSYSRTKKMPVRWSFVPDRHGLPAKGERGKIMSRDEILAELNNILKDLGCEELDFCLEIARRLRKEDASK